MFAVGHELVIVSAYLFLNIVLVTLQQFCNGIFIIQKAPSIYPPVCQYHEQSSSSVKGLQEE